MLKFFFTNWCLVAFATGFCWISYAVAKR